MKIIIIGAGAAGLAAAGTARSSEILILERNEKAGKKLYITGKGRCNVTNNVNPKEFLESVVSNPKFLISAINSFTPNDTINLIESMGIKTKTERGNRVFPVSDKSSDIIKALVSYAELNNAKIIPNTRVTLAEKRDEKFFVYTQDGKAFECDKLIIATGGKSYPLTGSSGDGYKLASNFGHTIIEPVSALTAIKLKEDVSDLSGLSLKNVTVRATGDGFSYSQFGEMLFTHSGVSGPCILTLSSLINRQNLKNCKLSIDLKPALTSEMLDKRILSDFEAAKNKQFKNSLDNLLPKSLINYIINYSQIPPQTPINSITKAQRETLVDTLKNLQFSIEALDKIESGIVTAGGIDVREVSPKTMESKLVKGLFFAGELLDIDAFTGGFNIQAALSTGYAAGMGVQNE